MLIAPNQIAQKVEASDILDKEKMRINSFTVTHRPAIRPYIGGCIDYQFTFGKEAKHQTAFLYLLVGLEGYIFLDRRMFLTKDRMKLVGQGGVWAD